MDLLTCFSDPAQKIMLLKIDWIYNNSYQNLTIKCAELTSTIVVASDSSADALTTAQLHARPATQCFARATDPGVFLQLPTD